MLEHDLYALTAAYGPSGREDGVAEASAAWPSPIARRSAETLWGT